MASLARVVVPDLPHHLTQRGNRRQRTFFRKDDYQAYLELMAEWRARCGVAVWAYCLMPNHVHLVAVPTSEDGLRRWRTALASLPSGGPHGCISMGDGQGSQAARPLRGIARSLCRTNHR